MLASLFIWFTSCFNGNKVASIDTNSKVKSAAKVNFYTLKATDIDGNIVDFSKYKGKKIVILNVASKCGYTPQYADWQKFYESHKSNTVVLGFPCNQFLGQEPGSSAEIETFCQKNYGVTFEMFEKIDVKGDNQSSVYKWLSDPTQNGWNKEVPSWNFCKYLIDEKGNLTHFFGSKIKPDSSEFTSAFEAAE
jgi:glutathione peroxidase